MGIEGGYGLHGLGNGPYVLGCNGPHLLGIMSHSALCHIQDYVAFGIMSQSVLCRIRGYMSFGIMTIGIMSHSG